MQVDKSFPPTMREGAVSDAKHKLCVAARRYVAVYLSEDMGLAVDGAAWRLADAAREYAMSDDTKREQRRERASRDGVQIEEENRVVRCYVGMTEERWALFDQWEREQRQAKESGLNSCLASDARDVEYLRALQDIEAAAHALVVDRIGQGLDAASGAWLPLRDALSNIPARKATEDGCVAPSGFKDSESSERNRELAAAWMDAPCRHEPYDCERCTDSLAELLRCVRAETIEACAKELGIYSCGCARVIRDMANASTKKGGLP